MVPSNPVEVPVEPPDGHGDVPRAGPPPAPLRRRRGIGPFSLGQVGLAVGTVVIAVLALTAVTTPLGPASPSGPADPRQTAFVIASPMTGLAPGQAAPEFEAVLPDGSSAALLDLDGRPIRLADLRGKAILVNFWASWCPPCQSETPTLRDLDEAYRDRGLAVVGINVQETVGTAREYVATYGLEYRIGADVSGHVLRAWQVFALPTQVIIDPDGIVRSVIIGPIERARAAELIEPILPVRAPAEP